MSNKNLFLSNYSLTTQIIIINVFTALVAFIFVAIFNIYLLVNNKTLEKHTKIINFQLNEITDYLNKNAIKRILTFDDTCNRVLKEKEKNCNKNIVIEKNYKDKKPQLDPTYTQQYIYSNYLNSKKSIKVFDDNWTKLADTDDFYSYQAEINIYDIDTEQAIKKNQHWYQIYKNNYFKVFNFFQKYFDEKKLKKIRNDHIIVMETIKTKESISYIFKDQEQNYKSIYASPILKDDKVYGVVLMISPLALNNNEAGNQSILLNNFFIVFIMIMFFLSQLFSRSIVKPIKLLSQNTQLERDRYNNNKKVINYPTRNDEIGKLSLDIKSMSSDLKKRINDVEEFVSDVSHELKNPLAGLKSTSDLLKNKKILDKNLLINNISEDIDRMNILISDISNYSLTQVEISEEAFHEIELISFLNNFKNNLNNEKFILEIKSKNENIYLKINKNKFLQVINNLLDNTFSFIEKRTKILIFIKADKNYCYINFVDQGPGISLKYKNKIFNRFYTDRQLNKKSHSGLGLSISRKIIESFGGNIDLVKSNYLGFDGACFEIKLPLKRF